AGATPYLGGPRCAAAALEVHDDKGLLLRHARAADFLVVDEAGARIVVTGSVWIASERPHRTPCRERLVRDLGSPSAAAVRGEAVEHVVADGGEVAISGGERGEELVAALGYRGEVAPVLRGTPERPVLVSVR